MKLFAFILFVFLNFSAFAQAIVKGTGVIYTNGVPTLNVNTNPFAAELAIDTTTGYWYEWGRDCNCWNDAGYRVRKINISIAPTVAPGDKQSEVVLNNVDSLYGWRAGAWRHLNRFGGGGDNGSLLPGSGIGLSGTAPAVTITNTAPDQVVTLTDGTGIDATGTYPNFTITNILPDQVVALTDGTGIDATGTYPNFTITNTLPDQVVTLTDGTGIDATGTYPNFTITNTLPDQVVTLGSGAGINVTGTYPNFTVTNTGDLSNTNEIQTLSFTNPNLSISGGNSVNLSALSDNWGTQSIIKKATLTGAGIIGDSLDIAQQGATPGQVLTWSGSKWIPGGSIAQGNIYYVRRNFSGLANASNPAYVTQLAAAIRGSQERAYPDPWSARDAAIVDILADSVDNALIYVMAGQQYTYGDTLATKNGAEDFTTINFAVDKRTTSATKANINLYYEGIDYYFAPGSKLSNHCADYDINLLTITGSTPKRFQLTGQGAFVNFYGQFRGWNNEFAFIDNPKAAVYFEAFELKQQQWKTFQCPRIAALDLKVDNVVMSGSTLVQVTNFDTYDSVSVNIDVRNMKNGEGVFGPFVDYWYMFTARNAAPMRFTVKMGNVYTKESGFMFYTGGTTVKNKISLKVDNLRHEKSALYGITGNNAIVLIGDGFPAAGVTSQTGNNFDIDINNYEGDYPLLKFQSFNRLTGSSDNVCNLRVGAGRVLGLNQSAVLLEGGSGFGGVNPQSGLLKITGEYYSQTGYAIKASARTCNVEINATLKSDNAAGVWFSDTFNMNSVALSGAVHPNVPGTVFAAGSTVPIYTSIFEWDNTQKKYLVRSSGLASDNGNLIAGAGISLSGTAPAITIANTSPDQVVSITGATGTYPNFTLPDASATNEIQTLSTGTNSLSLSSGGGTVTIDTDPTDEILTASNGLTKSGQNVKLGGALINNTTLTATPGDGTEFKVQSYFQTTFQSESNANSSFTRIRSLSALGVLESSSGLFPANTSNFTVAPGLATMSSDSINEIISEYVNVSSRSTPYAIRMKPTGVFIDELPNGTATTRLMMVRDTVTDRIFETAIPSGSSGTVTSVGISMPADFSVSGSPVTTSGTFSVTRTSQTANTFLGAPDGSAGTPSYRALVSADIPTLTSAKISDFAEAAQDAVGGVAMVAGGGININYNDPANTITISNVFAADVMPKNKITGVTGTTITHTAFALSSGTHNSRILIFKNGVLLEETDDYTITGTNPIEYTVVDSALSTDVFKIIIIQ